MHPDEPKVLCDLAAICTSVLGEDRQPLEEYLRRLGVDVAALWLLPRWNSEERGTGGTRPEAADVSGCRRHVQEACDAVVGHPAGLALLGLYLWSVCGHAWENTYRYGRIFAALDAFAQARHDCSLADASDAAAAEGVGALVELLRVQLEAEDALCSGDLVLHHAGTVAVVAASRVLVECAVGLFEVYAPLADLLYRLGRKSVVYHTATGQASEAARRFLAGDPSAVYDAIAKIRESETRYELASAYRSELRTYRFALERLAQQADSQWVHIDHARVTYLYSFGLSGCRPGEAVEIIRELAATPPVIAGVSTCGVHTSFELDDVWAGSDYLQRRFDGAAIELPSVMIYSSTPSNNGTECVNRPLARLDAEVRVSLLGNHYVRLATTLTDRGPQDIAEILMRADPAHGALTITCGEVTFEHLSELATALHDGVAELLSKLIPPSLPPSVTAVAAREGHFHVLLSVLDASHGQGPAAPADARTAFRTGQDLVAVFGGQALAHSVPGSVAAICDWTRFAVEDGAAIQPVRWTGGLVVPTANTTLSILLGTPDFMVTDHDVVAEFVGSLDGMISGWYQDLAEQHKVLDELLTRNEGDLDPAGLEKYANELRAAQRQVYDFAAETRSTLSLLHSPNLVESPGDSRLLSALLVASNTERRCADFSTKLTELMDQRIDSRLDAITSLAREQADRRRLADERRSEGIVQGLLGAIAVFGIAGLFQVLQIANVSMGNRAVSAELFAGGCLAIATALGLFVWHLHRRRNG